MSHNSGRIVTLLILFILVNTLPAVPGSQREIVPGEPTGTRGTIVVNASGGGDYTHIQWAVDNASDGDTVYVEAGYYNENIIINKTINLISQCWKNTTIDGGFQKDVVQINSDWVNISGFEVRNSGNMTGGASNGDAGIDILSSWNNIQNCSISNTSNGINFYQTSNNSISNCFVSDNRVGIYLSSSSYNSIEKCIVTSSYGGGNWNKSFGIFLFKSSDNIFSNNEISHNGAGIDFSLISTTRNIITDNNFLCNGIGIETYSISKFNYIYHNNFIENTIQARDNFTNYWDNGTIGNYWSDWTSPDTNDDGIVDQPYLINGTANAKDYYPLTRPTYELLPIADSGLNETINSSQTVVFDGNGSWGLSFISNYTWSFVYANATRHLYGPSPSFTFHIPGTYQATLIVTDSIGRIDADSMTITVLNRYADKYIIVDASGKGDYLKIQDGIENVSVGGTVFVRAGNYLENIVIDKKMDLIGAGYNNTTIGGEWKEDLGVVQINASWVNVSGFQITSTDGLADGIRIFKASNCRIFENLITYCEHGIYLRESSKNRLTKNICTYNYMGIYLIKSQNNTIYHNTCNTNDYSGINVTDSTNNTITRNICNSNRLLGISLYEYYYWSTEDDRVNSITHVTDNFCSNNYIGIYIAGLSEKNVTNNHCLENQIGIFLDYSESTLIRYNILEENQRYNMLLWESDKNTIHHNNFVLDSQTGIQAFDNGVENA